MIRQIRSIYLNCRHRLYTRRRRFFEALGSDRYSRAGLDSLDLKLQKYLDFDNGFFIEAGANDGFTQSNTYWLERFRGWRGILIEPIPSLYEICRGERSRSTVYNYALVSDNWTQDYVLMRKAGLMSFVEGGFPDAHAQEAHERAARRIRLLQEEDVAVRVEARSLNAVLDQHADLPKIDFLSLDVEGFECTVLEGLDLVRYQPAWILIETNAPDRVFPMLDEHYDQIAKLSYHDYLFHRKPVAVEPE